MNEEKRSGGCERAGKGKKTERIETKRKIKFLFFINYLIFIKLHINKKIQNLSSIFKKYKFLVRSILC